MRDNVSNHRCLDCLINALFRRRSKKTVDSPHKGPVTRKMFSFDDVIMVRMPQTPMRQPWRIWVNVSYESAKSDDITTKENKMKQTRVHILWDILNIITVFDSPCIYYGQSRKYNKTIKTTYEIVLWLFGAISSCCYVISRTSTYTTGIVVLKKIQTYFVFDIVPQWYRAYIR